MVGYEVMAGDSRGVNGDDEGKENPLSWMKRETNMVPKSLFPMVMVLDVYALLFL
jgi:hypothetical protein